MADITQHWHWFILLMSLSSQNERDITTVSSRTDNEFHHRRLTTNYTNFIFKYSWACPWIGSYCIPSNYTPNVIESEIIESFLDIRTDIWDRFYYVESEEITADNWHNCYWWICTTCIQYDRFTSPNKYYLHYKYYYWPAGICCRL